MASLIYYSPIPSVLTLANRTAAPTSGQRAADAIETDGSPDEAARKSADAH